MGNKNFCSSSRQESVDLSAYKSILILTIPSNYRKVMRELGGINSKTKFRLYTDYHKDGNMKYDCIVVDAEMPYYYEFAQSVYPKLRRNVRKIFLLKGENYIKPLNFK